MSLSGLATDLLLSTSKSIVCATYALFEVMVGVYRYLLYNVHPFWIEFSYYVVFTLVGSLTLFFIKPRSPTYEAKYVDMLYMSASAVTVSGLNSVDTELLSVSHMMVLNFLMFVGGEVFVSLLGLLFRSSKSRNTSLAKTRICSGNRIASIDVEQAVLNTDTTPTSTETNVDMHEAKRKSQKGLAIIVLCYILAFHAIGLIPVYLYYNNTPSARAVLDSKGLETLPFAVNSVVSSFANGGLIAANESLALFKGESGLLLWLIPQILLGNSLYPAGLRGTVWVVRRMTKRAELAMVEERPTEMEYPHLFPNAKVLMYQTMTTLGILVLQITVFCAMNWDTLVLGSLNAYQKLVAVLFQSVNSRHSGEVVFDFSLVATAVLVLFIAMMYLPAYTAFLPVGTLETTISVSRVRDRKKNFRKNVNMSQLSYVVIFVIMACMIERSKLVEDPLNFSMLNVVFEVMSSYGNVGLSMGYSCKRLLKPDSRCTDGGYSFSGQWSFSGKLLIVAIMLIGRMKAYYMGGGKAWKLR